ncbi:MAG: serine/threonine-protein phosphatase [Planctomycetota bacterium]|nr:MAG: serine/threonine-protein phosphatase [Planctomycetota bacterium]
MAGQVSLKVGHVSITGNFRDNNEDNCHVDPKARFFLVADGMGGQSAGEKASEMAIDLISERLEQWVDFLKSDAKTTVSAIERAVSHANSEIMALGGLDSRYHNMGTTVTFIVNVAGQFFVGGVGDSRTYRLRDGKLEQLTKDHSLTQALVDAGTISAQDALTHRYKNVLYKYLGTKEGSGGSDPKPVNPQSGDRYMLCSDGVTDGASNTVIRDLLANTNDPQTAAQKIVEAAQQGGSRDNITCVVVHVV